MARTTFSGPVVSRAGFIAGSGATITKVLQGSGTLTFPSISAVSQNTQTLTVTGAAVGDEVILALPSAPTAGIVFNAFVSAANTVSVRATNVTASPVVPGADTYGVIVLAAS
jgi:hypothetical protein